MAFWLSSRRKLLSILQNHIVMSTLTPQNPVFDGKEYAASRPSYPEELFQTIYEYHTTHGGQWRTAVDVACGTGQATVSLGHRFRKVYGLDSNPSQIEEAICLPNITYKLSRGETLEFDAASIDMITVAQAAHWLDLPRFYDESRRVLRKDSGTLAVWCYAFCHVDDAEIEQALQYFYNAIHDYWDSRRVLVDDLYRNLEFPLNNVQR
jgi:trans-aconitate 3-methyltransferase